MSPIRVSVLLALILTGCTTPPPACPPLLAYNEWQKGKLAGELTDMVTRDIYPFTRRALAEHAMLTAAVRLCNRPSSIENE